MNWMVKVRTRIEWFGVLSRISGLAVAATALSVAPLPAKTDAPQSSPGSEIYQLRVEYVGKDNGWAPLRFERVKSLILAQASINGAPATILFDNGFSHSVLDKTFAHRIGIKIHSMGEALLSGTGTMQLDIAEGVVIDIPHQVRLSTATGVVDFGGLGRQLGRQVDAVIGADVLGHMAIGIFSKKSVLMLRPSGTIVPNAGVHSREFPLVDGDKVDATINGRPVRLQIDLGSDSMITLSDAAWHRLFPDDSKAIKGTSVRAEGVQLITRRMPGNTLAFSGFNANGVVVENSGPLPGVQDGLLGQAILSGVDLILELERTPADINRPASLARHQPFYAYFEMDLRLVPVGGKTYKISNATKGAFDLFLGQPSEVRGKGVVVAVLN